MTNKKKNCKQSRQRTASFSNPPNKDVLTSCKNGKSTMSSTTCNRPSASTFWSGNALLGYFVKSTFCLTNRRAVRPPSQTICCWLAYCGTETTAEVDDGLSRTCAGTQLFSSSRMYTWFAVLTFCSDDDECSVIVVSSEAVPYSFTLLLLKASFSPGVECRCVCMFVFVSCLLVGSLLDGWMDGWMGGLMVGWLG